MEIYTLHVGQGQFVVVAGDREAVIVDSFVPLSPETPIVNVKAALAAILPNKNLVGMMATGFDADHFCEVGMKLVLNKYRPDWIMYPRYFKPTSTANACFSAIENLCTSKDVQRVSVSLSANHERIYDQLSNDFTFEVFSPHVGDMNSSNNCSLVCRIEERSTGVSYLVTGDTELDRWSSILRYFSDGIQSDVLAAPHHGSRNGVSKAVISAIAPHTVLISAGVNNQYDHPHDESTWLYETYTKQVHSTNDHGGQSLLTIADGSCDPQTFRLNL